MAFWGIEVKPGKPYSHHYDQSRGRLRVCQATLGNGKSNTKSVVQCNVGNKSPILLCNLLPDVSESCRLELEFEEDEEVVFSVLGQRSVHLSGFYISGSGRDLDGDETESYGEDIAGTDTSGSNDSLEDEDEYESDFIDDDDVTMFQHSPRRKSGVVIEEIIEDEKPTNGNDNRRRLKKKHQLSDSDDSKRQLVVKQNHPSIFESEDEDGLPISFARKRSDAKDPEEISKSADERVNDKLDKDQEEEVNKLDKDQEEEVKEQKTVSSGIETDVTENVGNPKKKKKKGKKSESNAAVPVERTEEEVKGKANEPINNDSVDKTPVSSEPEKLSTNNEMLDSSVLSAGAQENSVRSRKKKNKKRKAEDNNAQENEKGADAVEVLKSDIVDQPSNVAPGVEAEKTPEAAKKKKKKSKNIDKDSAPNQQSLAQGNPDEAKVDTHPHKPRTFPNGLVIEDLAMGKPDGKKASDGSKVFVNYIGKLKNGTIFDSNVGQRPFKFRLGVGEVIKGWDVGVKGMRIGDKRRLTIPPSFGYGEKGAGKKIPGNSWLVFDVELVNVQ